MQKPIWVKVLWTLASWLVIIAMIVLLARLFQLANAAGNTLSTLNSPGKGDMPFAESYATNTIRYWLAFESSTDNAYAFPSYLSGVPRKKILPDLIFCESTNRPYVVNPVDRDGTPSLGLLQFKPETLWREAIYYGLIPPNTPESVFVTKHPELQTLAEKKQEIIFVAQLQVNVASYMIMTNWKNPRFWLQQFPQCFRDYRSDWGV